MNSSRFFIYEDKRGPEKQPFTIKGTGKYTRLSQKNFTYPTSWRNRSIQVKLSLTCVISVILLRSRKYLEPPNSPSACVSTNAVTRLPTNPRVCFRDIQQVGTGSRLTTILSPVADLNGSSTEILDNEETFGVNLVFNLKAWS